MNYATRQNVALDRLRDLQVDTVLAGASMAADRERFDRLRDRHTNGAAPVAVSAFQLFQTPAALASSLVSLLGLTGGERILEPSAGLGRILDALAPYSPAEVVAVEMAPQLCAQLYRQERAGVVLRQRDFLTCKPEELGQFDAVAMNPPFQMRSDIAHVEHALRFLRSGGRLAGICMDTGHRTTALRERCKTWEPIAAGAFRAEGTNVPTVMFTIQS